MPKTQEQILNEIFGLGFGHETLDPAVIAAKGTKKLKGFAYGTLMRKADANGLPSGNPIEVKRGRIIRHLNEDPDKFFDRIHLHFQKPMNDNPDFGYTPHVSNLDDYLQLRAGRPFSHSTHTDPTTGEITFFSHHLSPIY